MLDNINIIDLFYFKSLVKIKSFSDMARRYSISQPTISIAIKRLEKELNEKLLERKKLVKGFTVKERGEKLVEFIEEFESEMDEVKKKIERLNKKVIRIGVSRSEGIRLISKYLKKMYSEEKIMIEIKEMERSLLNEALKMEEIDYYIYSYMDGEEMSSNKKIHIDSLEVEIIYRDTKNIESIESLNGETIISLKKGTCYERILDKVINKYNIEDINIVYVESIESLEILISKGIGVGLLVQGESQEKRNYKGIKKIKLDKKIEVNAYLESEKEDLKNDEIIKMFLEIKEG